MVLAQMSRICTALSLLVLLRSRALCQSQLACLSMRGGESESRMASEECVVVDVCLRPHNRD